MANKDNEIPVVLTVDTSALSELEAAASAVPDSIDIDVNADTSGFDTSEITDLDGEVVSPEIDTTESEGGKEVREGITFLATVKKIEIAMNIIGNVIDFVKDVGALTVAPFLDVEDAVAKINAQTGGTGIEDLGQLIRDLQAADLGDSVQQIGDTVIAAQQLNLPIKEAATAALTFTHTFKDEDPTTVLEGLSTLVKTGLVPNLQAAADLMTVSFQQGVNTGGDLLNVTKEYSQQFADMHLTGSEAMSAINSLMDSGVASAGEAAKMILTVDEAFTTAAANADSPQAQAIATLGIDNPKEQGLAIGNETIDGVALAFANLPLDQQDLISKQLFGKGGAKFTGAIAGMTTQGGPFQSYIDAAAVAATEVDNSLRGAIDDFVLAINTSIADLLSSDSIDLPGKIAALKEGLQKGVAVLSEGGTVGEALEVALNIPGLSDTIDTALLNIQRVFGQLVLALLDIVATIQDPLGLNNNDDATRAQMKTMATQQLPFDIKVANPDELDAIFSQAARRGVTDLGGALNTALTELVNEGDFSKVQAILGKVLSDPTVAPEDAQALADKYDKLIADAKSQMSTGDQTTEWWNTFSNKSDSGTGTSNLLGNLTDDTTKALDDLKINAETNLPAVSTAVTTATDESVASLQGLSLQAQLTDTDVAAAMTDNTVTASFEAVATAAETNFPIVLNWFGQTKAGAASLDAQVSSSMGHISKLLHDLQFLADSAKASVLGALQVGANPGAGGGSGAGTTNNNTTVNQTNNNQNGAQTAATTYQVAAAINGA